MNLIITLLIAATGGLIATKIKFPAGALIGALIAVAIYNIMTLNAFMPLEVRIFTQIISGIFIGSRLNKSDILVLIRIFKPALLTIVLLFISCISMGLVMHYALNYDIATTLFATAPGGLLDTTLMSIEMNADTAVVSVLQITRLVTVISLFPTLLNLIIMKFLIKKKHDSIEREVESTKEKENSTEIKQQQPPMSKLIKLKKFGITVAFGTVFGLIGYLSKIPAGTLMFTMIGIAILNIFWSNAYIPTHSKKLAQILGGSLIGMNVTLAAVIEMKNLILPAIYMMIGFFIINILLALVLYKKCNIDMITALFSCTPGGATTISLMADDFGANAPIVSTLQIIRSIAVIALYPFIIQFIYTLVN